MTLEEFRQSKPLTQALAEFLASDTGAAILSVLRDVSPAKELGRSQAAHHEARTLRGKAAVESQNPGTSDNLLGTVAGYEQALAVLDLARIFTPPPSPRASRKGGKPDDFSPEPNAMP